MKQILQSLKTGNIELIEVPVPSIRKRHILIETQKTLISAGTERMLIDFGKANLLEKALQQPDKVKQTLDKLKTDGFSATYNAVTSKLDQPIPLGYCNAGFVRQTGQEVEGIVEGDRVVSNGNHAEVVVANRNLVAKIPDNVSFEEAAFTPLAAIALQSLRLAKPQFGETFCVIGLGLVGLMTVQLLRASGCRVIGVDFEESRLKLAESSGAQTVNLSLDEDAVQFAMAYSKGNGIDGVIIAAATKSQDPMRRAAEMCRKRGRIVLVGVTGLNLSRDLFFQKELSFSVSCSYGPGRYDPNYEIRGEDYPIGYVRWTEQRNFTAVLEAMAQATLDVKPLISKSIALEAADAAYKSLGDGSDEGLGILLDYTQNSVDLSQKTVRLNEVVSNPQSSFANVALIGAGSFGGRITAQVLKKAGANLKTIVSLGGLSGAVEGRKAGFEETTTDLTSVLENPDIDTIVITTRHDTHAQMAIDALNAGKHVFIEKPLALTEDELDAVEKAYMAQIERGNSRHLIVGFNRRFSPLAMAMKDLLDTVSEPISLIATINAGSIPKDHWAHDPEQGGGRIIGEACHMIDLMRYFTGAKLTHIQSVSMTKPTADGVMDDKASISMNFDDGSIATVHYFANGPSNLSKERYEAFAGNKFLRLDNFTSLEAIGFKAKKRIKTSQDKGHSAILKEFISAIQNGGDSPIPFAEVMEVSRAVIAASR